VRKAGKARTLWFYMPLLCPISRVTGHPVLELYLIPVSAALIRHYNARKFLEYGIVKLL
jgi:hypothetical protein